MLSALRGAGRRSAFVRPRAMLAIGGSALVGAAVATTPAQAEASLADPMLQMAGVAAVAAAGYLATGGSPSYGPCPPSNSAFVFLKPHASTEPAKALVKSTLEAKGFVSSAAPLLCRRLLPLVRRSLWCAAPSDAAPPPLPHRRCWRRAS